jgi:hypothetical protein
MKEKEGERTFPLMISSTDISSYSSSTGVGEGGEDELELEGEGGRDAEGDRLGKTSLRKKNLVFTAASLGWARRMFSSTYQDQNSNREASSESSERTGARAREESEAKKREKRLYLRDGDVEVQPKAEDSSSE